MSDDNEKFKLLKFSAAEKAVELKRVRTDVTAPKFGIYPLGSEDVVLSIAAFLTIIGVLEDDSLGAAARQELATLLRNGYLAPWAVP